MMTLVFVALIVGLIVEAALVIWVGNVARELRRDEAEIGSLEHVVAGHGRRLTFAEERMRRDSGKRVEIDWDDRK